MQFFLIIIISVLFSILGQNVEFQTLLLIQWTNSVFAISNRCCCNVILWSSYLIVFAVALNHSYHVWPSCFISTTNIFMSLGVSKKYICIWASTLDGEWCCEQAVRVLQFLIFEFYLAYPNLRVMFLLGSNTYHYAKSCS